MNRSQAGAIAAGALLVACCLPWDVVAAATNFDTADKIEPGALMTLLSSFWSLLSGKGGKVVGAYYAGKGLSKLGSGNERDKPWHNIGGGAGIAFVPALITSMFDAAPALSGPLTPVAPLLHRVVSGFLGIRLLQDPVFWVLMVCTGLMLGLLAPRRRVAMG